MPPFWFIVRSEIGHDFTASSYSKISGFTRLHVIGFNADLFFPTLEGGFKNTWIRCPIRRIRVDVAFVVPRGHVSLFVEQWKYKTSSGRVVKLKQ